MAGVDNLAIFQAVECLFEIVNNDSDYSDDEDLEELEKSDDETLWEYSGTYLDYYHRRESLSKLQNYVEDIVQAYTEKEFQSHFR